MVQSVVAVNVLVVVRPSDVRERRIDFELHLCAVRRLAVVGDGHPNNCFLSVPDFEFAGLLVSASYVNKRLKLINAFSPFHGPFLVQNLAVFFATLRSHAMLTNWSLNMKHFWSNLQL